MSYLPLATRAAAGLAALPLLLLPAGPALAQVPLPPAPYPSDGYYA